MAPADSSIMPSSGPAVRSPLWIELHVAARRNPYDTIAARIATTAPTAIEINPCAVPDTGAIIERRCRRRATAGKEPARVLPQHGADGKRVTWKAAETRALFHFPFSIGPAFLQRAR